MGKITINRFIVIQPSSFIQKIVKADGLLIWSMQYI